MFGAMIGGFGVCMFAVGWQRAAPIVEILILTAAGGVILGIGVWMFYVAAHSYTRLLEFGDDRIDVKWFRRHGEYKYDEVVKVEFEHAQVEKYGVVKLLDERTLNVSFHDGSEAEITLRGAEQEQDIRIFLARRNVLTLGGPILDSTGLIYQLAYSILPAVIDDGKSKKFIDVWAQNPDFGRILYVTQCRRQGIQSDEQIAEQFQTHHGSFENGSVYYVLEYPPPRSGFESSGILLPLFSVCVISTIGKESTKYFVIGQSATEGIISLRKVQKDGKNCCIGRGTEVRLEHFLVQICEQIQSSSATDNR